MNVPLTIKKETIKSNKNPSSGCSDMLKSIELSKVIQVNANASKVDREMAGELHQNETFYLSTRTFVFRLE